MCEEKDTLEVDIHKAIITFLVRFRKKRGKRDTGVANEDVDPSEFHYGFGNGTAQVGKIFHIHLKGDGAHAECSGFFADFFCKFGFLAVTNEDIIAFFCKEKRCCTSDAAGSACDDCGLVHKYTNKAVAFATAFLFL